MRRIVAEADPDQPITAGRTMDEILELAVADRQQQMLLLGAFAAWRCCSPRSVSTACCRTLVLQRSRELGLRLALGATAGSVMRIVVGRGLALTAPGLASGWGSRGR